MTVNAENKITKEDGRAYHLGSENNEEWVPKPKNWVRLYGEVYLSGKAVCWGSKDSQYSCS